MDIFKPIEHDFNFAIPEGAGQLKRKSNEYVHRKSRLQLSLLIREASQLKRKSNEYVSRASRLQLSPLLREAQG